MPTEIGTCAAGNVLTRIYLTQCSVGREHRRTLEETAFLNDSFAHQQSSSIQSCAVVSRNLRIAGKVILCMSVSCGARLDIWVGTSSLASVQAQASTATPHTHPLLCYPSPYLNSPRRSRNSFQTSLPGLLESLFGCYKLQTLTRNFDH